MSGGPIFHEDGQVVGVICSGMQDNEADFISHGSMIWPVMGAKVELILENSKPPEWHTLYDLAKKGVIKTDESLNKIRISEENGNRRVELMH